MIMTFKTENKEKGFSNERKMHTDQIIDEEKL